MSDAKRSVVVLPLLVACLFLVSAGCEPLGLCPFSPDSKPTINVKPASFQTRAKRRAFDGAPPVIPHDAFGITCTLCHTAEGKVVPTVGIASANPHLGDRRGDSFTNCNQCHLFALTDKQFVKSDFAGLQQIYQPSERAFASAPPVIPHSNSMRSNCAACHSGVAARAKIACTHSERANCVQCHVEVTTDSLPLGSVSEGL